MSACVASFVREHEKMLTYKTTEKEGERGERERDRERGRMSERAAGRKECFGNRKLRVWLVLLGAQTS